MRAIVSPDDLKKGELIPPSWYPAQIDSYDEKDADTDGSTNAIFTFKIIDGPYKGYSAKRLFNEKALGFGKNLWASLDVPYDPQKGYEITTEMCESFARESRKVDIYIKRGKSNKGNEFNDVADFRKPGA